MFNFLDFIFPKRCCQCGKIGDYICQKCQKSIQIREFLCPACDRQAIDGITHIKCLTKSDLTGLISIFRNTLVVKKTIKLLKYRFVSDAASSLINLIPPDIFKILKINFPNAVLYSIPLHQDRLKWRGFNQAEKLGNLIADKLNMPIVDSLLIRFKKSIPQADIRHKQQRIENAKGLFKLNKQKIPKNIILFDDVWTTGATIKEAAKVLKKGGAEKIWALTLAR